MSKEQISHSELTELKEAFALFDKNGDGSISASELATVLKSLGQAASEREILDMIREVDKDNNGEIDFEEFCEMMRYPAKSAEKEMDLADAFRMFDKDGDGVITEEELFMVMSSLGESFTREQVREMIAEADRDGDGQVDYGEFMQMMSK